MGHYPLDTPPHPHHCGIILAAGESSRLLGDFHSHDVNRERLPKPFVDVKGLWITTRGMACLATLPGLHCFILVVPQRYLSWVKQQLPIQCKQARIHHPIEVIAGGASRAESAHAGIAQALKHGMPTLWIHDACRPNLTPAFVQRIANQLSQKSERCLIPVISVVDSIKLQTATGEVRSLPRSQLVAAQTPQIFPSAVWQEVLAQGIRAQGEGTTDDAEIVERHGMSIFPFEGDPENFKITYPRDLAQFCAQAQRWFQEEKGCSVTSLGSVL